MIAPVSEEMIEAGLQHYSEGGCSGLADYERREVVKDILTAGMQVFGSITPDERSEYWKGAYERMAAKNIEQGDQINALKAALEFYADRGLDGYDVDLHSYGLGMGKGVIIKDAGDIARAALEAKP